MDSKQFLVEFGHIANAPGGIVRLRELVLRLAVQGKLVAQSDLDEPAKNFIGKLSIQPKSMVGQPSSHAIRELIDQVHNLPVGWIRVPLNQLANPQVGFAFKASLFNKNGIGIPIVRVRDVGFNTTATHYSGEYRDDFLIAKGDWLVAMDGDFRIAIWNADTALLNQRVTRLQFYSEEINKKYVCIALQFELRKLQGLKNYTTVDHLSGSQIAEARISLPPLEEQFRIVAKVEELMALCDQLEAKQKERRKLQNSLRQSILQALSNAQNSRELQDNWQRLQVNFELLFSESIDVDDLIAELKNIAVSGGVLKSFASRPDLERIKADCAQLRSDYMDRGLIRRQKMVGIASYEMIYPKHWAVVALDEVAIVSGGITKGRNLSNKQTMIYPYLAVANVQRGYFKLEVMKSIEVATDEFTKYQVQHGDLLITEGGDRDKVGRTAIWRGGIDSCVHQNHVFKVRVPSVELMKEWVELVLNSGIGRDYFASASKQTTNLASINMSQLRSFPIPIPPLDEQRHILALLNNLTLSLNEWRVHLDKKQRLSALFANAVISSFTGIAVERDKELHVKAPIIELIAPLFLGVLPSLKDQAPLSTILARHNGEMSAHDLFQRFGGDVDAFYAQLKIEVIKGWIVEPVVAEIREKFVKVRGT